MVHAGCWAHARSGFLEAVKLNPNDVAATGIVVRIDELFGIDARAREQNLDAAARHALREEHAGPLLDNIRNEVEAARARALPAPPPPGPPPTANNSPPSLKNAVALTDTVHVDS